MTWLEVEDHDISMVAVTTPNWGAANIPNITPIKQEKVLQERGIC